ncbi:WD40 repeat domain-containing protein [Thermoflexibacter ruber]|uniref:WD domain-containing protein, G-beta repeat-containing protein n=1 Tax=Thermoflexibacter ruber TaxID=1003 RepID=A0A1I2ACJ9_9BACT|nr:WD40 repeat domain-containing protein [Thermoflexibacter ruber]SFE41691.1 WD domain-containing protein, G-beta repeat-containing protein [Thermoflexibacter ruber]
MKRLKAFLTLTFLSLLLQVCGSEEMQEIIEGIPDPSLQEAAQKLFAANEDTTLRTTEQTSILIRKNTLTKNGQPFAGKAKLYYYQADNAEETLVSQLIDFLGNQDQAFESVAMFLTKATTETNENLEIDNGKEVAIAMLTKTVKEKGYGYYQLAGISSDSIKTMSILSRTPYYSLYAKGNKQKITRWQLIKADEKAEANFQFKFNIGKFPELSQYADSVWIFMGEDNSNNPLNPKNKWVLEEIWDRFSFVPRGNYQKILNIKAHQDRVYAVAFSPDGQKILTGSGDRTAKLYNLEGKILATLQGHTDEVKAVAFSKDGNKIATGSADNTVRVWNVAGELLQTFKGHQDAVSGVGFSADGQKIASASYDETIKIWAENGSLLQSINAHDSYINSLQISPDNQTFITGSSDKTAKIWDWAGNSKAILRGHRYGVYSVTFDATGKQIATGSEDGTVKLWNIAGTELASYNIAGESGVVYAVTFTPDSKQIVTQSKGKLIYFEIGSKRTLELPISESTIYGLTTSPDGHYLLTANFDESATLCQRIEDNANFYTIQLGNTNKQFSTSVKSYTKTQTNEVKVFDIKQFGIYAYGKPYNYDQAISCKANFTLQGQEIKGEFKLYHLTGKEGTAIINYSEQKLWVNFKYVPQDNNKVVLIYKGKVSVIDSENFKKQAEKCAFDFPTSLEKPNIELLKQKLQ